MRRKDAEREKFRRTTCCKQYFTKIISGEDIFVSLHKLIHVTVTTVDFLNVIQITLICS